MRRVCIISEGQTEAYFVQSCLVPHLLIHQLHAYASILKAPSGRHRGGRVTVERLVRHISHEYHQADRVTTLVDFYGFKDRNGRNRQQLEADILTGVAACTSEFDTRFVLPYVQMYEFEGLLFSDIEQFQFVIDGWNEHSRTALQAVQNAFNGPEDINDSEETAPSKRIEKIFSDGAYSKTEHGPLIAEAIGLSKIRRHCPQFHEWISRLEAWGANNGEARSKTGSNRLPGE